MPEPSTARPVQA